MDSRLLRYGSIYMYIQVLKTDGVSVPAKFYFRRFSVMFSLGYCMDMRGVRGRVARVADLESLAPHRCGFESRQAL